MYIFMLCKNTSFLSLKSSEILRGGGANRPVRKKVKALGGGGFRRRGLIIFRQITFSSLTFVQILLLFMRNFVVIQTINLVFRVCTKSIGKELVIYRQDVDNFVIENPDFGELYHCKNMCDTKIQTVWSTNIE